MKKLAVVMLIAFSSGPAFAGIQVFKEASLVAGQTENLDSLYKRALAECRKIADENDAYPRNMDVIDFDRRTRSRVLHFICEYETRDTED